MNRLALPKKPVLSLLNIIYFFALIEEIFVWSCAATERIYYEDPTGLLHGEESSNDNMDNRTQEDPAHRSNESTLYEDITTEG